MLFNYLPTILQKIPTISSIKKILLHYLQLILLIHNPSKHITDKVLVLRLPHLKFLLIVLLHIRLNHCSSNTFQIREHTLTGSQSQTTTPPRQSTQTIHYILAQPSISQNTNTALTINTLHTNHITNTTTSRTLSRHPLPLMQNNPISYNLTSTNFHSQPSSNTTRYNTNIQSSSTQFNNHIPSTTIQTNPHIHPISIQPQTNTLTIPPNSFNSHTTDTISSSTTPLTTINTRH